jgi:ketosteroid isomerase-like protein
MRRSVDMSQKDLEERIKLLEDIEAIKQVKYNYCYTVDAGDVEGWLTGFTDDAIADFGHARYEGKKELRRFVAEVFPSECAFTKHHVTNPVIKVNGDKATGTWYAHVPGTFKPTGAAMWIGVTYEEEYVRKRGKWKCSLMVVKFNFFTPYDQGWAKKPFLLG